MTTIAWLPWSAAAFDRARAENRPVLLSICASWCRSSREMDLTSYADPAVVEAVRRNFVPVRVDADRRPDISERYSLGGLPSTVFLTPEGSILGGGTYVPRERLAGALEEVARAFGDRRHEGCGETAITTETVPSETRHTNEALAAIVFASFDHECGGFGDAPKFPLTAPLHLALERHRESSDPAMAHVLVTTLDAMGWGPLHDDVDGGFFRYATTRDWRLPHEEKLLDVNAALLRIYLDAAVVLEVSRYRDRAVDVLAYLQRWLADAEAGGWWGSQEADSEYYSASSPEVRRTLAPPQVDRVLYAGWNAGMVSAALLASRVLQDDSLAAFAVKSLERVLLGCYRPGSGVAHYHDGSAQVVGLLDDQVAMLAATLDAYELTGNIVYEMMAEELAYYALRTMWDEEHKGFYDRAREAAAESIGLLRRPLKPFVTNCEAARALHRLAATSGEHVFAERAAETLASIRPGAADQGPLAAHYLLAARELQDR